MPRLRKSDIKKLSEQLQVELDPKAKVELDDDVLLVNDQFSHLLLDGRWIPSLPLVLRNRELLPKVVVDMGAVRFVANGADIMRPGIINFPDVAAGELVSIVDEKNDMPLAIGKMLLDAAMAEKSDSGKSVANLHYVGDDYWQRFNTQ